MHPWWPLLFVRLVTELKGFGALFIFTYWTGYDTRSIFKRSLTGLNSEFSFSKTSCLTKAEEPSLSYYLPIAGGRIIGFIPFPRVLVLCEMQSVSARIWTRVAVSIFYDDNHYTTGALLRKPVGRTLAELGHSSHNDTSNKCTGRVPIYVHPCFYRSLKQRFTSDVGGISRESRVITELGTGSLRQTVGILTPQDFWPVVDSE